ncbi:GIY-YIG nuclease family protein [Streptomyces rugosispiralis]|uniref:GIY-YIG nuclease family protein n=1 Tax=Streptomyces rugosispiralis TaxID=2967341 RepID=A0ABT1VD00_9ACTN|nr:GIY-YIG nuclease family protein [Streptomyces rugosispiralis]MCQ8195157.1 GIY-YIG nuclease family protein [Streptomyces rugosispiralis]
MSTRGSFQKLVWHSTRSVALAHKVVPDVPGVYAYAELSELRGLAITRTWMYVGKGQSLSGRLNRHQVHLETNRLLRDWLHRSGERELHYAEVEVDMLDQAERDLISQLQPRFNRTRYAQHSLST